MTRRRAHSPQTVGLLRALAADPTSWRHGYDLGVELGLRSGSLYPILIRLCDRGLLESAWETPGEGRPPRHLYRLTSDGLAELAAVARAESRATPRRTQLGTA
jgi:PadR family transcriptional regulator, regulatory protein PadR